VKCFMKLFDDLIKKDSVEFAEIRGREAVLAEGYGRILAYGDSEIILSSQRGGIVIRGEGLTLRHLSTQRVAVEGRIDGIEFI